MNMKKIIFIMQKGKSYWWRVKKNDASTDMPSLRLQAEQ
jgi:hypothetical protein